jgi:hypothetical protein
MPEPRIWRNKVAESGTKYNRARLTDRNGNVLTRADFTNTILRRVYDLDASDADTEVLADSNAIATWVFNSLQTWEDDGKGYNFEAALTTNQLTMEGGHTYRVCYYLTRLSGSGEGVMPVMFENKVEVQYGA